MGFCHSDTVILYLSSLYVADNGIVKLSKKYCSWAVIRPLLLLSLSPEKEVGCYLLPQTEGLIGSVYVDVASIVWSAC